MCTLYTDVNGIYLPVCARLGRARPPVYAAWHILFGLWLTMCFHRKGPAHRTQNKKCIDSIIADLLLMPTVEDKTQCKHTPENEFVCPKFKLAQRLHKFATNHLLIGVLCR